MTTTSYCRPQEYLAGNQSQPIRPCGLAAWSLFNDTFQVCTSADTAVAMEGSRLMDMSRMLCHLASVKESLR